MKEIAKRILPKFLLELARVIRETRYRNRQTYSGVYTCFDDVAKVGGDYADDEWPATAAQYSRWAIAKNESGGFIPAAVSGETSLLPLLISVTRASSILDFGGATGFSYIAQKYGVMRGIDRYVIVEHPNVCAQGRELFKDDVRVEFLERIPQEQFDLVFIGAALQYVSDYKGLLKTLTGLKPRWILITKLPAGENVTFVSAQVNLPRMEFTSWLFNARELVLDMESLNYELIFRSANDGRVNQEKLEPKYRLEQQCNLLFETARS